MNIVEINYSNLDTFENLLEVEFVDEDGNELSDQIEYDYYIDFGYGDETFEVSDFDEESDWEDFVDGVEIDNDSLISFLNEYYSTYPERIPQ
jgi:hypothetical protein